MYVLNTSEEPNIGSYAVQPQPVLCSIMFAVSCYLDREASVLVAVVEAS